MMGGILAGGIGLLILGLMLLASVFWIWMIVDCAKSRRLSDSEKVLWILVIIFLHLLGAIIYYCVGRKE